MRITAEAKRETRTRIITAARELFESNGFEGTSTRDLASAAGIAAGTLFNYFPSKEALAMTLVLEALDRGREGYFERRRGSESLDEDLFAHIAAGLRELEPFRPFLGEVREAAMSPFGRAGGITPGEEVRVGHLETVATLLEAHGLAEATGFVSIHLYWTLYLGVLAFWSRDESPNQEDTLVVLDQSLRLFTASVANGAAETEEPDGPESC